MFFSAAGHVEHWFGLYVQKVSPKLLFVENLDCRARAAKILAAAIVGAGVREPPEWLILVTTSIVVVDPTDATTRARPLPAIAPTCYREGRRGS